MTIGAFLVTLVLAAHQHQAPRRDTRPASVGTAAISGIVTTDEAQARPLRRARVTLNGASLPIGLTAITADDGTFAFGGLAPGRYEVIIAKDAYVSMSYGARRPGRRGLPLNLAAGASQRVTIRLPRGAVITGTVLDVDGAPAQGITVSALERRFVGADYRYVPAGTPALPTDDRGTYRIYGLPAGDYLIAAQPQTRSTNLNLSNDRVQITGRGDRAAAMTQIYAPSATEPAHASRVTVRAGEERSGVDVQLQYVPLASISGAVVTPTGWPPAEVALARSDDSSISAGSRATRTNIAGLFFFTDLPPGEYRLLARATSEAGGVLAASADVTLDGEDVENLALPMQPGVHISGSIVFRGSSPPPALGTSRSVPVPLSIALGSRRFLMPPLQIAGDRFTIEGALPGIYRIGGDVPGVRRPLGGWWLQSIEADGVELLDAPLELRQSITGAIATFTDRASEVSGTVGDAAGHPVSDAVVVAFPVDRAAWFFDSRRIAGVRAGGEARYVIRNLPPGDYRVAAVTDLSENEWYDPGVLERLLPGAIPMTITGSEQQSIDVVVR